MELEVIDQAYETLREERLCWSQIDYSQNWLGMSKSYYSAMRAINHRPGYKCLSTLLFKLDEKVTELRSIPSGHLSESIGKRITSLQYVRDAVSQALATKCGVSAPQVAANHHAPS